MNNSVLQKKVTVGLPDGLHLRPQSMLVQCAQGFESNVTLSLGDQKVDAKSMLDLMTMIVLFDTELLLEVSGSDASVAIETIALLFESDFKDD